MIDFLSLKKPTRPNNFLACTDDHCMAGRFDMTAPQIEAPIDQVAAAWDRLVAALPRVEETARSADGWQREYVQRSKTFGFADRITVRFATEENGADPATRVLMFSAAEKGYYDFGVNRRRVTAWLDAVRRDVAVSRPPVSSAA